MNDTITGQSYLRLTLPQTPRLSPQTPPLLLLVNLLYVSTIGAAQCSVVLHDSMWFLGWDGNGKPLQCNAAIQKWAGERFNVILQNYLLF